MELLTFVIITAITVIIFPRRRWIYILYKTIARDIRAGIRFVMLNIKLRKAQKSNKTVPKLFMEFVEKHPQKVAFYFEDEQWTYKKLDEVSNQVAHYFKNCGYKRGDTIALLLESKPEYVALWLGLSKIGVITALINNNLVLDPLIHSIKVSNAKAIIFGSSFAKAIKDIQPKMEKMELFEFQDILTQECIGKNLKQQLEGQPKTLLVKELASGKPRDKLLFIYTSGTTGLPKAAVITNMRFLFLACGLNLMTQLKTSDILYDPLPLYHSAGGTVGIGQCISCGISVVIRKKFSASNFWSDCVKYNCTAAQYIGEICRYILAAHSNDRTPIKHNVRAIIGNGLRPQIWTEFLDRFKIPQVYEFYGATEGNSNLMNIDGKIGAVGFVPRYASRYYPVTLIKCDESTGEPLRNSQGYCIKCNCGEAGMLIGKVRSNTTQEFEGYADKKDTQRKLISNVFKKGDLYFNSGDILLQDEFGYYYFKDRTGDTFRWKGENVATAEIEAVVSNLVNFKDAAVYGVQIPETEGRAGMAAVVDTDNTLNIEKLAINLKAHLPTYAVPVFLRVMKTVSLTGTFKLKKVDLQKEGFNVNEIKDPLYFYDAKNVKYTELTKEIYDNIMNGKVRL